MTHLTRDLKSVVSDWRLALKRGMDFMVSAFLLLLLLPLFLGIALAIWVTMGGPIFYCWEVVGLGGRPFCGYKFRTMVKNADRLKADLLAQNEMTGPVFKITHDPRVTPVGTRAAQAQSRRVAAAVECPERRHESRRAAPSTTERVAALR